MAAPPTAADFLAQTVSDLCGPLYPLELATATPTPPQAASPQAPCCYEPGLACSIVHESRSRGSSCFARHRSPADGFCAQGFLGRSAEEGLRGGLFSDVHS